MIIVTARCNQTFHTLAAEVIRPQYYEVRVYTTQSADQQQQVNDYWQKAAVPACNRLGISSIGVFTELQDSATNHIYVLIPYESPADFAALPARLAADTAPTASSAIHSETTSRRCSEFTAQRRCASLRRARCR